MEGSMKSPYRQLSEWVHERCALAGKSPGGIHSAAYDLTPELANYFLENNPENRAIRQSTVDSYTRDMLTGRWHLNGEPIIISKEGQLNDGQHRCWAVVQAGKPVMMVFTFGVARETRITLDQGVARRLSDYLAMEGVANATRLGTVAGQIWRYTRTNTIHPSSGTTGGKVLNAAGHLVVKKSAKPSKQELMALLESDPLIMRCLDVCPTESKLQRSVAPISIFHFVAWLLIRQKNSEAVVSEFLKRIVEGTELTTGAPELYIRNRLMSTTKMNPNEKVELILRGWNALCRGESVSKLPLQGGKLPEIGVYKYK